ncbi:hypothetical protein M405DRAFT_865155 [Rhizopogon salebrosus TDB-379]|jgi:hypothetical protein|nr:hypothetical protein M405DRAFT_865155 [Rhizopogon salebrosus TDB-379]
MSEDVRKKMSNAVASQAGGKYAWMNAANAPAGGAKPKPAGSSTVTTSTATTTTPATTTVPAASTSATTSWARPYLGSKKGSPTPPQTGEDDGRLAVTMRDAITEKEKGHGGRGATRGWS